MQPKNKINIMNFLFFIQLTEFIIYKKSNIHIPVQEHKEANAVF